MQKKLYRHSDSYLKALQKFDSVQLSCEAFFSGNRTAFSYRNKTAE